MNKRLFLFAALGCLGITNEIFFTAAVSMLDMFQSGNFNFRLEGKSYVWMFPIYGLAGLLYPLLLPFLIRWNVFTRLVVYASAILTVEFITGWLLDVFTGSCPWEYKTGWHIKGYIRLDYFPLWALFGLMVERVVIFLQHLYDGKYAK